MIAQIMAILAASLLGSAHCTGMCGGFVMLACGKDTSPLRMALAYHSGRLGIYVTCGALAGALGSLVNIGTTGIGIQQGAARFAGATMMLFGLCLLAQEWGVAKLLPTPPRVLQSIYVRAVCVLQRFTPGLRAFALGLLSAALPCGWLYAFLFVAAGTGNALSGMLSMLVFWAGTLPALLLVGTLLRCVQSRTMVYFRRTVPVLLVFMGLLTCFSRSAVQIDPLELTLHTNESPAEQVARVSTKTPACCAARKSAP